MDLYEYQGKQFFATYGIPVSPGEAVTTVDDAVAAAERIGYPVVVKAQVQVGGRGKAGGIKLANDADEVRTHAGNILGMDIKGHTVEIVWVELASRRSPRATPMPSPRSGSIPSTASPTRRPGRGWRLPS
jgi:succinyl-CoA synthetase beta subunit